jgi:SlyX protein
MTEESNSSSIEDRFERLETRVLYQDRTIEDLNTVVTRQQNQIDALTSDIERLRAIIQNPPQDSIDTSEEPPPPHY